jgi:glutamate-1-semialdehyde 2,1-aminomutase
VSRDYASLTAELRAAYEDRFPRSAALHERAVAVMVDGGSHGLRLNQPFPPRIASASGAYVTDVDGHTLVDLWQGHFANILGHAPAVITEALAAAFWSGHGLQLGMTAELQIETAELLCTSLQAERLRFTTSGTLATMYAVMLARAFTGRGLVVKVAGGFHGAHPWGLKGIGLHPGSQPWTLESEGLPAHITDEVVVSRFNDLEDLEQQSARHEDDIACLIVEPFLGGGNFMPARPAYLNLARVLTEHHGALLILDEVISAFRFRAGDVGALYGVRPDLVTVGKIIGGGMPVAAVAGRADVMALCGREGGSRVAFSGGTYSAHPASLLAAKTMVSHLVAHEAEIYPRLAELGERQRNAVEAGFASEGVLVRCSGGPNAVLPGSSLAAIHFPLEEHAVIDQPHVTRDPAFFDVALRDGALQLALLLEDVYTLVGSCALSTAHNEADIERVGEACRAAGRRIKTHL